MLLPTHHPLTAQPFMGMPAYSFHDSALPAFLRVSSIMTQATALSPCPLPGYSPAQPRHTNHTGHHAPFVKIQIAPQPFVLSSMSALSHGMLPDTG